MIIKNSNLRRELFSNRYKILMIIVAIILTFLLIRFMNQVAKNKLQQEANEAQNYIPEQGTYIPEETVISGSDVPQTNQEQNTKIIEQFITYCNNKEVEKAYSLLSNECREQVFNSNIQNFKQNYIDKIFTSKKTYTMQSWISKSKYTYQIKIMEDIMASGDTSIIQNAVEDYYTIVKKDKELKLNIKGYIGREELQKETSLNGITIRLMQKDIFKEYENYQIQVENNTQNTILLDSRQNTNSVYLKNENDKKYQAFMHEAIDSNLVINSKQTKTMNIKFNKIYSNSTKMRQVVFEDIILNYDIYKNTIDKTKYSDRLKIVVDL